MKRILTIPLLLLISYAIMTFITLEWNLFEWEYYSRICMLIIFALLFFIHGIVSSIEKSALDTTNDEIIESYKENKKRC